MVLKKKKKKIKTLNFSHSNYWQNFRFELK